MLRARPSCGASRRWPRWCWRALWLCSSRPRACCTCIRCSALWRHSRKPRPSVASPTGTPWWRCSAGRWDCRSRTPLSSRPSAPHRGQARRIHRGAFSRSRARRRQAAPGRLRLLHRRLAARPQAQHRSRPLHAAAFARSRLGDRNLVPDDVHHPPHQHPVAVDRSRAARRRHQGLLDDILRAVHQTLTQPENMAVIRDKIRGEMPTLLKLYRADKFLVNRIVASATTFFEEVRNDPKHPFRGEFDRMILSFVDRLGSDRNFADRIGGLKRDLLARPELGDLARNIWLNTRSFIERSATGETLVLQQHLARMLMEAGEALAGDSELRGEINQGLVAVFRSFIADQKSGVSSFISDQVKAWDMGQLISLIEINIGKDLQYIRFNGSLIGGLAGLALYSVEFVLRWW